MEEIKNDIDKMFDKDDLVELDKALDFFENLEQNDHGIDVSYRLLRGWLKEKIKCEKKIILLFLFLQSCVSVERYNSCISRLNFYKQLSSELSNELVQCTIIPEATEPFE